MSEHIDRLFSKERSKVSDFRFDKNVALVFDDMIHRSIPFYEDLQALIVKMASDFAKPSTHIYDLGTATGYTLSRLATQICDESIQLVGIDNSADMLEKAQKNAENSPEAQRIQWVEGDLSQPLDLAPSSVCLLVLTLQFLDPEKRLEIIQNIYESLTPGSALILVEKVKGESPATEQYYTEKYYEYKESQGYSQLEISQKREALEHVLIPYTAAQNLELLTQAGFQDLDIFFKWLNFMGILAIKPEA